jgi:S1-C subfamily serine protease
MLETGRALPARGVAEGDAPGGGDRSTRATGSGANGGRTREQKGRHVKTKAFIIGLVGGVVGAALIFGLFLLLGGSIVKHETTEVVRSTPATFASPGAALSPEQIYRQATPSVVEVQSTLPAGFFGQQGVQGVGTGFVASNTGLILTNAHVVVEYPQTTPGLSTPQLATKVQVVFKDSGTKTTTVDAQVLGVDGSTDVALLRVDPGKVPNLRPLPLGDSSKVQVGEPVVAIGNPLGLEFTMTSGIVSALDRTLNSPTGAKIQNGIQTDAAINEGNSGGPLIDASGRVIGINEQIATATSGGSGNIGLGFAVPINTAVTSMRQLQNLKHEAWLGVYLFGLTPQLAQTLNLPVKVGVEVASVIPGSPAEKAGLQGATSQATLVGQPYPVGGDIITAIDGQKVTSTKQLQGIIAAHKPGDRVTLTVVRNGSTQQVQVTLGTKPVVS